MAPTSKDYRLEALKIANTLYTGKGNVIQPGRFLEFASEVYEFIVTKDKKEAKTDE